MGNRDLVTEPKRRVGDDREIEAVLETLDRQAGKTANLKLQAELEFGHF